MQRDAHHLHPPGGLPCQCQTRHDRFGVYSELVTPKTGCNVRVGFSIHRRIEAKGNAGRSAQGFRQVKDPAHLTDRLDVDLFDAGEQRQPQFGMRLPDPGENDPLRRHTGIKSALQFTAGNDIRPAAQLHDPAQKNRMGIGLDGIVDGMRQAGKGRPEASVTFSEMAQVVEVTRLCAPGNEVPQATLRFAAKAEAVTYVIK